MLKKFIKPVFAHCDIPCGIYETDSLKHSADTCLKMVEKIEALGGYDSSDKLNNFVRMVNVKEEHAQKVKDQIYILWSDYFKTEHVEKFPDLHDLLWKTAKQASVVKHSVSREACEVLLKKVSLVDEVFKESK